MFDDVYISHCADDVPMFRVVSAKPVCFRGEGFYTNDKEW